MRVRSTKQNGCEAATLVEADASAIRTTSRRWRKALELSQGPGLTGQRAIAATGSAQVRAECAALGRAHIQNTDALTLRLGVSAETPRDPIANATGLATTTVAGRAAMPAGIREPTARAASLFAESAETLVIDAILLVIGDAAILILAIARNAALLADSIADQRLVGRAAACPLLAGLAARTVGRLAALRRRHAGPTTATGCPGRTLAVGTTLVVRDAPPGAPFLPAWA